ncbi:PAS domain S-box protein [Lentisphaerota bacterium ZTH]|nr:PAS domain S-box protein [Lentisphaerota bacterium]WET05267.1 PAS domain S-box protein [Lentisphaerota bacterium ZTH]
MRNEFKHESYRIAQKLISLFVLITFLSWISAGYMAFYHAAGITKQAIINNLISIAQNKANYISKYFASYKEYINIISMNQVIIDALQKLDKSPSKEKLLTENSTLEPQFKKFCRANNLDEIMLISSDGRILFALDKELVGLNVLTAKNIDRKLRRAFQKGRKTSNRMSSFIPTRVDQEPYAYVTSWVMVDNKFGGLLTARINVDEISNIINNTKVLGTEGEMLVGSKYGNEAYFIGAAPELDPPVCVRSADINTDIPMAFALNKTSGYGYFKDYRGKEVIADWRYLPDLEWGLVIKIDKDYAFQPVYRLEKWFLFSGLLAIAIVSVVALLTAKSIVTPLRRINIAVTEKAAAALRRSEKKYRTLFETANDGILLIEDEVFVDCNQKALKMFGLKDKKEIERKSPLDFTAKEQFSMTNAEELAHQYITAALKGDPQRFYWKHIKKDGTPFDVEVALNQLELNSKHYVQAIVRDITERKQATEALRESERRFFNMSQNVPGMVHHCQNDTEWTMEFVSEGCLPLTGYRTSELLFNRVKSFHELIYPEDQNNVWDQVQIAVEKHRPFDIEYRIITKSGDVKWVNERGVGVYTEEGKLSAIEGIIFDITRRKNFENELKAAHSALEQRVAERTNELKEAVDKANAASRAKSSFLSMMSHEIRTPMNAILGFTQLMRRDSNLNEQQNHNLDVINRSGEHLLALINDVLEISKIEAGRTKIAKTQFSIKDMLKDMEAMFKVRTESKNLWLKLNIDKKMPEFISADAGKIRQIIINLIGNAVKFTNSGGVEIKAYSLQPSSQAHNKRIFIIEVNDTGCGIAADKLNLIFVPFEQADREHWQEGTGLGLPISLQYAKLIGGDITVQSTEGKGCSFLFQFSAETVDQTSSSKAKSKKTEIQGLAKGEPEYKLLVADDNDTNRQVLAEMLKAFGFKVSQVENGKEAFEEFKNGQYDAVLLDQHMPEMDGLTTAARIKGLSSKTPIIMVTASTMEPDKNQEMKKVTDEYICKPYIQEDILKALKRLLGCKFTAKVVKKKTADSEEPCSSDLKISSQLKAEMISAIENGKQAEFKKLVKQSSLKKCQIGMLVNLADKFAYEKIIELLQTR